MNERRQIDGEELNKQMLLKAGVARRSLEETQRRQKHRDLSSHNIRNTDNKMQAEHVCTMLCI